MIRRKYFIVAFLVLVIGCGDQPSSLPLAPAEPSSFIGQVCPNSSESNCDMDEPFTDPCPTCDGVFITSYSPESCYANAGNDPDSDDLDNACEYNLATAFAPQLIVQRGCNYDYTVSPARMGGEYFYAVQGRQGGGVRIAYLPAYYRDCGAVVSPCQYEPFGFCDGHTGDSEFVFIDISYKLYRSTG